MNPQEIVKRFTSKGIRDRYALLLVRCFRQYKGELAFDGWAKEVVSGRIRLASYWGVGKHYAVILTDILRDFYPINVNSDSVDWMQFEYEI